MEGGAKLFGVFRVKNHDFTPKNHIFTNSRGGARRPPPLDPPLLLHKNVKILQRQTICHESFEDDELSWLLFAMNYCIKTSKFLSSGFMSTILLYKTKRYTLISNIVFIFHEVECFRRKIFIQWEPFAISKLDINIWFFIEWCEKTNQWLSTMWDNFTICFTFSFVRHSTSFASDLQIWTLRWNCPISHSRSWLSIIISSLDTNPIRLKKLKTVVIVFICSDIMSLALHFVDTRRVWRYQREVTRIRKSKKDR